MAAAEVFLREGSRRKSKEEGRKKEGWLLRTQRKRRKGKKSLGRKTHTGGTWTNGKGSE